MNNFITKFETENFKIGSFDAYQNISKELIKNNDNLTDEEVEQILKSLPTTYRASIVDKNDNYIGYISLYNYNGQKESASIRLETKNTLSDNDRNEIMNIYKEWLFQNLNFKNIEETIYLSKDSKNIEKDEITPSANIIIPSKLLKQGISEETLEYFSNDYNIPKLQMPFSIINSDKVIGIVGLSNVIWSNRRANLNIYLDKNLGVDITNELSGYIIDEYVNYVHSSNIHNVTMSVNGSNHEMIKLLNSTNMNYYGNIPYGAIKGDNIESNLMFQHIPYMKKENGIIIPDNKSISLSKLDTEKKELAEKIELDNGYKMISPKAFEKENIDSNVILNSHIKAMQNRDNFTIPLGEDKYILQKGNENYGITKAFNNYSYIILDEKNNYSGYINIFRSNANGKNIEIEVGIDPSIQRKGLGTIVVNRFYEELFSIGVATVTSAVFEFNNPSIKLHEKVAQLNGIRLESYYINGKLWNMNFYSKVNNNIEESTIKRI